MQASLPANRADEMENGLRTTGRLLLGLQHEWQGPTRATLCMEVVVGETS